MKSKKKVELSVIILLVVIIGIMTVGFAAYSQKLNIGAANNVTVKPASWNVHFVTTSYAETTKSVAATTHSVTNTDYSFTTTLQKPGDFYEATVTVQNEGTLDAQLKKITMSTLNEAQQKYLKYTVTYAGTEYTETTSGLAIDLVSTATATLKVRLDYLTPASENDLPSTDQTITITGSLDYEAK